MQHWDLTAANEGSRTGPRVLFSTSEARAVLMDLAQDEEMGDHQVRERALVHRPPGERDVHEWSRHRNVRGGRTRRLEPGEPHTLRALQPTRLLLTLAPWPAEGHYDDAGDDDPHDLPVNATQTGSRQPFVADATPGRVHPT